MNINRLKDFELCGLPQYFHEAVGFLDEGVGLVENIRGVIQSVMGA